MQEFADNVYVKLMPYVNREMTILEIGCASGITMYRLAPYVARYIGTDMAKVNLEKNRKYNMEHEIDNIILKQCRADEIDQFCGLKIDIIVINSVIQYFDGIDYLVEVMNKAIGIINDMGIIFLGDIRDLDRRDDFENDVRSFRTANGIKPLDFNKGQELFLSKEWVRSMKGLIPGIQDVEISDKIGRIRNELLLYRFDALLKVNKDGRNKPF